MKKIKDFTNSDTLKSVYYGLVQPHFDCCCEVWNAINRGQSERLQKLHNRCARIIMNFKDEPGQSQLALYQLGWISLEERRKHIMARLMFKVVNNLAPLRISSMFQNSNHSTVIIYEVQIRLSFCQDQIPSMAENVFDIVGLKSGIAFLNK
jgi:hypothetical protein